MNEAPVRNRAVYGEILGRDAVPRLVPAWKDLCARAAEDNVYYSPQYVRALLDHVETDKHVTFAVVWDQDRLIAMLPVGAVRFALPLVRPARAWQTKFTFNCMPLLDKFQS